MYSYLPVHVHCALGWRIMWSAWLMIIVMEAGWCSCCSFTMLFAWWADPESLTEAVMISLAGLNSSCTLVVTVQDENNNPPVFSQHEVRAHVYTKATVFSGHDEQWKGRPNITGHCKWLLDCRLLICSAGHWSNFPGGKLDMLSNLRLIAMAPCYWREFYSVLCTQSGLCSLSLIWESFLWRVLSTFLFIV